MNRALSALPRLILLFTLLATQLLPAVRAQQPETAASETSTAPAEEGSVQNPAATLERLAYVQSVLSQKIDERSSLGEAIQTANEQDQEDLRAQAEELSEDIQQLRDTLETIAIGGVDNSLFAPATEEPDSNWREDIALIAQPVIDSLKDLTEKPRKIKELNDRIALRQQEQAAATQALDNLAPLADRAQEGALADSLDRLVKLWQGRLDDARSDIEIARFQIADLQGDKSLVQTLAESLQDFLTGRGLTLLLAILAASIVYFGVRFLMRGYRSALVDKATPESRTRYRLAAYSVQALTFILILIAVFVVFYQRGDVLLLGLLILLIVGLALGIRNLLPRYLSEARLLLNIGPMRESERIMYRGLPWRVESINMYTVLRNPELHGVLRIPLAEFHDTTSRPSGKDPWFPSSRGDTVLLEDHSPMEVIDQNPDTVVLKHRGGQLVSMPAVDFYRATMTNLSRGDTFGVTSSFGVDYRHQDISLTQVPKLLRDAVREQLSQTDLASFIKDVRVELKLANDSSLDYWIFVTCDSRAAKSYRKIERTIQSACVDACTRAKLIIPFPHLSVLHQPG
ncbi:hypothetical protein ACUNV4_23710 [Granulosicoccus sp. 3-233]|uniref:hypothetical protein n=1 Tax=Granulosicoccus sp. 3-233 TaxID=3417969 RepID=UPI003D324AA4